MQLHEIYRYLAKNLNAIFEEWLQYLNFKKNTSMKCNENLTLLY